MHNINVINLRTDYNILFLLLYFLTFGKVQGENDIMDEVLTGERLILERQSYTWTIQNFSKVTAVSGENISSPIFHKLTETNKWQLILKTGERRKPRDRMDSMFKYAPHYSERGDYLVYLSALHCNNDNITFNFILSFIDESVHDENITCKDCSLNPCYLAKFQKSHINTYTDSFGLKLTIETEIVKYQPPVFIQFDRGYDSIATHENKYEVLLTDSIHRDVVIEVEGTRFQVHKSVLAVGSSVFSNIFANETVNHIEVNDINKETMLSLVEFIYTRNPPLYEDIGKTKRLLIAANKYKLLDLKHFCEKQVMKNLEISNALDILILANSNDIFNLKTEVLKFIAKNIYDFPNIKSVLKELNMDSDLLIQVISQISETKSNS